MPGLEDETPGLFNRSYNNIPERPDNPVFTAAVIDLLAHAMKPTGSAKKQIATMNKVIRHFADNDTVARTTFEGIGDHELRSYELIALWEQMGDRARAHIEQ